MSSALDTIYLNLAFEDALSEAVLRRLLRASGRPFEVRYRYTGGGSGYLKRHLRAFNSAARVTPYLVLADLDQVECAPRLVYDWLTVPLHPNLLFRVAVREVESWLIADRASLARFLGIQVDLIPQSFDDTADPKAALLRLVRFSRHSELRSDLLPREGSTSRQGPNYNARMSRYVEKHWDPEVAARYSPSLARTVAAIKDFAPVSEGVS